MVIGALGELVFETSFQTVRTVNDVEWSGSARWATHERHAYHALTEFVGIEPDEMSFELYLSRHLGTDPIADLIKLWDYERKGIPVSLVIGGRIYGKYRWTVTSHKTSMESFDRNGDLVSCTVSVKLLEYLCV